jgi:ferredoxin-NADP reductase
MATTTAATRGKSSGIKVTDAPAARGGSVGTSGAVQNTRWQQADVREVIRLSPSIVVLRLSLPARVDHLPGQHYVVRLTADDGYSASRSYSIASAPDDELVELCVERLADGEVSGYLYDELEPGDQLEVRGPIGGWFVWDAGKPALGIGGGSGVVPIVAMARHADHTGAPDRLRIAASGRTPHELPYYQELRDYGATVALTRHPNATPGVLGRRLAAEDLAPLMDGAATAYVCGSAGFAESISQQLLMLGYPQSRIRLERFGPT